MFALADPDSRFWPSVRLPSKLRTTKVTKTLRQEEDGRFWLSFVQAIKGMQRSYRQFRISRFDQNREFYFGGRNRPNIDAFFRQRLESERGHAGMAAHADADRRNLHDIARPVQTGKADPRLRFEQNRLGPGEIG